MGTRLGTYVRTQRFTQGIRLGQLARMIGCKNISKGAGQINRFEIEGHVNAHLLQKIVDALGLDPMVINQLIDEDRDDAQRAWNAWADEVIRPYLVARVMAAVYCSGQLPDDALAPAAAETYASSYAKEHGWKVCLVMTNRVSIWFDETGRLTGRDVAQPGVPNGPYVTLGRGRGKPLVFDPGDPATPIKQVRSGK
jgi:hypothetical protein